MTMEHGSKYRRGDGYVVIQRGRKWRRFEHRIVMDQKLGRRLERHEVVHHINGDRSDNRPENLELCKSAGIHVWNHHRQLVEGPLRLQRERAKECGKKRLEEIIPLWNSGITARRIAELRGESLGSVQAAIWRAKNKFGMEVASRPCWRKGLTCPSAAEHRKPKS